MSPEASFIATVEAGETKAVGFIDDLLTKGGRRMHAAVVLMAVPVMCICCLILTVAAARGAFRKKTDVQTLQIELLSAYGTLSALVGYVWKKGKENEDDDAPATPPSA